MGQLEQAHRTQGTAGRAVMQSETCKAEVEMGDVASRSTEGELTRARNLLGPLWAFPLREPNELSLMWEKRVRGGQVGILKVGRPVQR